MKITKKGNSPLARNKIAIDSQIKRPRILIKITFCAIKQVLTGLWMKISDSKKSSKPSTESSMEKACVKKLKGR